VDPIYSETPLPTIGAIYRGPYKNGRRNGVGDMKYSNGCRYTGEFVDNRLEGLGRFTMADGAVVEAVFKDDRIADYGHLKFPDGTEYYGHFAEEKNKMYPIFKREGRGKEIHTDGTVYIGNFRNGRKHRFGRVFPPGEPSFDVEYDMDRLIKTL